MLASSNIEAGCVENLCSWCSSNIEARCVENLCFWCLDRCWSNIEARCGRCCRCRCTGNLSPAGPQPTRTRNTISKRKKYIFTKEEIHFWKGRNTKWERKMFITCLLSLHISYAFKRGETWITEHTHIQDTLYWEMHQIQWSVEQLKQCDHWSETGY